MSDGNSSDGVDQIRAAWLRELPDLDPAADAVSVGPSTRLRRAARLVRLRRDALLRRLGTDEATLDLLSTLRRSGPPYRLTPGELGRASLVSSGAVSQRLDRAEAAGLVARAVDPLDGRRVVVALTAAGHAEVERVVRALLADEDAMWRALLGDDQRAVLDDSLRALLTALTNPRPASESQG